MSVFVVDASLVIKWFVPGSTPRPRGDGSAHHMTTLRPISCFQRHVRGLQDFVD